jgi:hypothetical protein
MVTRKTFAGLLLVFAASCESAERPVVPLESPPRFSVTSGEGTWMTKASMPTARSALAVDVVNGIFYAVGGSDGNVLATVQAYNPFTNTWTTKASMPTARWDLAAGVVNGILYAVGGHNGTAPVATVEAYDPTTDTWTTKASMPTARFGLAVGVVNGVLYAVGGSGGAGALASVEAYNPATNTWTTKASMPTARFELGVGAANGTLYAIGGSNSSTVATVEMYNPATNTWTTKASMPTARAGLAVGVVNDILYAVGGAGGSGIVATVEAYNPANNTWTAQASMPTARYRLAAGVRSGVLYAVGGSDDTCCGVATVEAIQPTGVVFQSKWSTALGTSPAAFTDGGRWDEWSDAGFNTPDGPIMAVVAGGPNAAYPNALRVQQRGGCADCWADVRQNGFIVTGNTDYYVRFYFMTADVSGVPFGDHGVEPWINDGQYEDIVYLSKLEGPTGWGIKMRIGGNGPRIGPYPDPRYPVGNWFLTTSQNGPLPLSYNTWYRLEYWVHFTSTNHMQVHPRVYTASGTLPLYQDADFVQDDYGSASDCGQTNDWTLALWYSRIISTCNPGGDFEVNLHPDPAQAGTTLQSLVMGNNGQDSAADTRLFWYYAGVQIRTDTWPGP